MAIIHASLFWFLMSPMIGTSVNNAYSKLIANRKQLNPETAKEEKEEKIVTGLDALKEQLLHRYGLFWRRKLRWILVTGERNEVEKVAPGLIVVA